MGMSRPRSARLQGRRAAAAALGAPQLQVEASYLKLLVRVRGELHVLLEPIVFEGLDHDEPGVVLQKNLRHLAISLTPELLVERKSRRAAQFVELRVTPVVLNPTWGEEPPHHAVGIPEGRGGVGPPETLER